MGKVCLFIEKEKQREKGWRNEREVEANTCELGGRKDNLLLIEIFREKTFERRSHFWSDNIRSNG